MGWTQTSQPYFLSYICCNGLLRTFSIQTRQWYPCHHNANKVNFQRIHKICFVISPFNLNLYAGNLGYRIIFLFHGMQDFLPMSTAEECSGVFRSFDLTSGYDTEVSLTRAALGCQKLKAETWVKKGQKLFKYQANAQEWQGVCSMLMLLKNRQSSQFEQIPLVLVWDTSARGLIETVLGFFFNMDNSRISVTKLYVDFNCWRWRDY